MVTLGGSGGAPATRVVGACTLLVGRPGPSTPDHGDVDVSLSASPLSGPGYDLAGREGGDSARGAGLRGAVATATDDGDDDGRRAAPPPGNLARIAARRDRGGDGGRDPPPTDVREIESWVRRTIRSSRYVDPADLCIERGASAWRVRVSLHVIEDGGNVCDAALMCACAALADLSLPTVSVEGGGVVRIVEDGCERDARGGIIRDECVDVGDGRGRGRGGGGRRLSLGPVPVPLTVAILPPNADGNGDDDGGRRPILLADPTKLEEGASGGDAVTAVCNSAGEVVGFRKGGGGGGTGRRGRVSTSQMAAIACMGFGRARELGGSILGERI